MYYTHVDSDVFEKEKSAIRYLMVILDTDRKVLDIDYLCDISQCEFCLVT